MAVLNRLWERLLRAAYRPVVRRALARGLLGREVVPGAAPAGRFLASDVASVRAALWRRLDEIDLQAEFAALPNFGNRHNVFLAAVTLAGYRALRDHGIAHADATVLLADIGWHIYMALAGVPLALGRMLVRDPRRRVELVLRALMVFPFSAPGRPGYEVRAWTDDAGFHTHWTCCPPYELVRREAGRTAEPHLVDTFQRSWCRYDWGLTYALVDRALGHRGRYTRPHTLSYGDAVCDMCWSPGPRDGNGSVQPERAGAAAEAT